MQDLTIAWNLSKNKNSTLIWVLFLKYTDERQSEPALQQVGILCKFFVILKGRYLRQGTPADFQLRIPFSRVRYNVQLVCVPLLYYAFFQKSILKFFFFTNLFTSAYISAPSALTAGLGKSTCTQSTARLHLAFERAKITLISALASCVFVISTVVEKSQTEFIKYY